MKEEIILDVDRLIENSSYGHTTHSIQREFLKCLADTLKKVNSKKIITNGNIASVLQNITTVSGTFQDTKNNIIYNSYGSDIKIKNDFFIYGDLNGAMIFVNPNLKWDKNKIYFIDKDEKCILTGIIKDDSNALL